MTSLQGKKFWREIRISREENVDLLVGIPDNFDMLGISFMAACKKNWTNVFTTLLTKDNIEYKNADGQTGFMEACKFGSSDVVNKFLKHSCL